MESVKMWVMSIAVGAIAGAVALALSPSDSLGKTVRTTVSVFLISAMLMPLTGKNGISFDFEITQETSESTESEITASVAQATADAVKEKIHNLLEQNGILHADTDIKMKVNGSEISVESVKVAIPSEYADKTRTVKKLIKDELQINAEVILRNGERGNGDGSENT